MISWMVLFRGEQISRNDHFCLLDDKQNEQLAWGLNTGHVSVVYTI